MRSRNDPRTTVVAGLALSGFAGLVVLLVATELFPYHSVNHDEAVYLQGADLLLDGRLRMTPEVPGAVRPWFFVRDGDGLYPKYAPVPSAIFAAGNLLGGYRVALAVVAAANVGLTCAIGAAAFDRRTGLLAGGALLATPTFLITSSVFLPYAPTTALNLTFALAYLRAVDREGTRAFGYATLSGLAIGLAFFARPYTALLFGAPFVVHALWTLGGALRERSTGENADADVGGGRLRSLLLRYGVVAGLGLSLVGITLAYNAAMTGSPWLFPFEAFAPRDGLGFGRRRILDHAVDYTPGLALRATAHLLWEFGTRWTAAPPFGTLLFGVGVGGFFVRTVGRRFGRRGRQGHRIRPDPVSAEQNGTSERTVRWLLVGVVASVVVGNVYFWGNYNILETLSDPTDGFVAGFGPIYQFDVLVPLAIFGARGALWSWRPVRAAVEKRVDTRRGRRVALGALLLVAAVAGAGAEVTALYGPVEGHVAYTDRYAETYAPIEDREFDRTVVFVPSTYGPWLNHPFQSLRNDPAPDGGLEGPVVYARDRGPAGDFAVLEAYPDRTPYRFTYRGEWTPDPTDRVIPKLRGLERRHGATVTVHTTVATPPNVGSGAVRLSMGDRSRRVGIPDPAGEVTVRWQFTPDGVGIEGVWANGSRITNVTDEPVGLSRPREVALAVTFVTPDGATLTYRQELDARPVDGSGAVEVIWPPEESVCRLVTDCGLAGTYLPNRSDVHLDGVWMTSRVSSTTASRFARPVADHRVTGSNARAGSLGTGLPQVSARAGREQRPGLPPAW